MKVIGIAGRIGSGKSAVGKILSDRNFLVLDLDKEVHVLYETDANLKENLLKLFGKDAVVLGVVNRKLIADKVFKDPAALLELENIVFPSLQVRVEAKIDAAKNSPNPPVLVAVEGATLFKWEEFSESLDEIWVVEAPQDVRLERLVLRGLSMQDAQRRMDVQQNDPLPPNAHYIWVNNAGSLEDLELRIGFLAGF